MLKKSLEKIALKYSCEFCNYTTCKKCDYNKHIGTAKHRSLTSPCPTVNERFECGICSKNYGSRVGLWYHTKKCSVSNVPNPLTNEGASNTLFFDIIKENQEFKNLLIEQQKENKELMNKMIEIAQQQLTLPTTIINNPTTNNNQQFNLNLFLNETCKDAMNIQEFLDDIKVTFEELLTIGNAGFVNGITDILIKRLRDIEISKRPIHCTDMKRETIYLKECDSWNKDDGDNTKLKDIIEKIEKKNVVSLHQWCTDNPDSRVNNTPNNLLRDKIFYQTLLGEEKTREKIIKQIVKEVTINKTENLQNICV
jgi:hypothetical protein